MTKENIWDIWEDRPLSKEEQAQVALWCAEDTSFADQWKMHTQMVAAWHLTERAALKKQLQHIEQQVSRQPPLVPIRRTWIQLLAAAAILLLLGIWWMYMPTETHKQLYADYFRPYPNVVAPITRGAPAASNLGLIRAFTAYDNQEYHEAEKLFHGIYVDNAQPFALFYMAICQMEQGQSATALTTLAGKEWPDTPFNMQQEAQWYMALCQLAEGNLEAVRLQLETIISNKTHLRWKNATELLKKLP